MTVNLTYQASTVHHPLRLRSLGNNSVKALAHMPSLSDWVQAALSPKRTSRHGTHVQALDSLLELLRFAPSMYRTPFWKGLRPLHELPCLMSPAVEVGSPRMASRGTMQALPIHTSKQPSSLLLQKLMQEAFHWHPFSCLALLRCTEPQLWKLWRGGGQPTSYAKQGRKASRSAAAYPPIASKADLRTSRSMLAC